MRFSLIIPTRDRPILFNRTLEAIWSHTTSKNNIELLVICDDDDNSSEKYIQEAMKKWSQLNIRLLKRERTQFSNRDYYNWGADQAKGELVWIFADDLEIVKYNWDEVVWEAYQKFKESRPDNCFCISVKDNTPVPRHDMPKFPCFPLFTKESRNLFGWYLHTSPPNWGVDYICYQIFNPLDRILQLHTDNFLNHISYHTHQVAEDSTALRVGNIFNKLKMIPEFNTDRILSQEVPLLREKLKNHIDSFKLETNNARVE